MNDARTRLEKVAEILNRHGVEYIVVGGIAANLHGRPVPTDDIDLTYKRDANNLDRLAAALREIGVALRGAPPDLPFKVDARSLSLGSNFTFTSAFGDLDLLGYLEPIGDYEAVARHAETLEHEGVTFRVIAIEDLIRIKEHIRRPKDLSMLADLLAIKRERDRSRQRDDE